MSAFTDPVGRGVERQLLLRQLEQQAAQTNQTSTDTAQNGPTR